MNFCTPSNLLECLKSSISIGENCRHTNTKTHEYVENCAKWVFVLVCHRFSPILILLFKHSRKFEGVQKFILKKPSYILVYGKNSPFKSSFSILPRKSNDFSMKFTKNVNDFSESEKQSRTIGLTSAKISWTRGLASWKACLNCALSNSR
jgi:hypothetical protein